MDDKKDQYEVLPAAKMREKYGLYAENRPQIVLDPRKVPEGLRHLIPMAEKWGITDDLILEDFISTSPPEEIEALKAAVEGNEDALDEWLAGPDADDPQPSDEYVVFAAMRLAADLVPD